MIVWLASYPRSGNTLLRTMLKEVFDLATYSKYNDETDIGADASVAAKVGHQPLPAAWAEAQETLQASPQLHLVKTHDGPEDDRPAIVIVRHGWPSVVSNQHYLRDFFGSEVELDEVISGGPGGYASWGHMLDLWNPLERPNTLLVRYEDLLQQPEAEINRLAEFLNVSVRRSWENNFDEMKRLNPRFFRQGNLSLTVDEFGREAADLFERCHGDWMDLLGYTKNGSFMTENEGRKRLRRAIGRATSHLTDTLRARDATIQNQNTFVASLQASLAEGPQYQQHINALLAQLSRQDKEHQQHLTAITSQLDALAKTSREQKTFIETLENERDRLAAREHQLTSETQHYLETIVEQTGYIRLLEAQRTAS